MIHSLFGNEGQDQNKPPNKQYPQENLVNMRKGVMVNGSEVYYGKGRKVDIKNKKNKITTTTTTTTKITKKYETSKKIVSTNNSNAIKHYQQISYIGKEDNNNPMISKQKKEKLFIDKEIEFNFDNSQPSCFISVRLYNGDIIKGEFNCNQKIGDIYSFVRRVSRNNNFILLEGFPPKPLVEYNKTIEELGLQNSVLTQRI